VNKKEFIQFALPYVLEATNGTGVFPSVALARAIIETSDGRGNYATKDLHRVANNYFGITAQPGYKGKKILVKTWEGKKIATQPGEKFLGEKNGRFEYMRFFRAYNSPADSFKDFVKLINTTRYKAALNAKDAATQAAAISAAGYATAPNAKELFVKITKEAESALSKAIDVVKKNPVKVSAVALLLGVGLLFALTR